MAKHRKVKPAGGKLPSVSLVVTSYLNEDERRFDALMALLYSIRAQTYPHCDVSVVHDGPIAGASSERVELREFDRLFPDVNLIEAPTRKGNYGHPWRHWALSQTTGDYIALTNDDNLYAPVYFEWMLSALTNENADLAFCDMVHSHREWRMIDAKCKRGFMDVGNWIAAAALAKSTPWTDMTFAGDWTYFESMRRASKKAVKVPGALFVHN